MKSKQTFPIVAILTTLLGTLGPSQAFAEASEEYHQSAPLAEGGRVSVENVNGAIRIDSWDRAEVQIDAVKRAKTEKALSDITIEFKADKDWVNIKTHYPKNNKDNARVEYRIKVPRRVRLDKIANVNGSIEIETIEGNVEASTVNGSLSAKNIAGAGEFKSVNGSVKVSISKLGADKNLALDTVNGSVELTLPSGTDANVKANTVNGGIHNDLDLPVKKHFPIGSSLEGKLGNGGSSVTLHSVNGSVNLKKGSSTQAEAPGK